MKHTAMQHFNLPVFKVESTDISGSKLIPKSDGVKALGQRIIPKGISSSAFQRAWDNGYDGSGIIVAVLDTGVDRNHPDLTSKVVDALNMTGEAITESHGTHVAGTIVADGLLIGGARGARILDIKVLGRNGGNIDVIADAIRTAADRGAHIINMSLGGSGFNGHQINSLRNAIVYAWNKGSVCIAASGNDGNSVNTPDRYSYPAAIEPTESIAACEVGDNLDDIKLAYFSNENDRVDLAACGYNVVSTIIGGKYAIYSGTSMATPHVSAMAACLAQYLKQNKPELTGKLFSDYLSSLLYSNVLPINARASAQMMVDSKVVLTVQPRDIPSNISYGRGFLRYEPRSGPVIPSDQKSVYNGTFVGHIV
jgi:subtilisin family serine protease